MTTGTRTAGTAKGLGWPEPADRGETGKGLGWPERVAAAPRTAAPARRAHRARSAAFFDDTAPATDGAQIQTAPRSEGDESSQPGDEPLIPNQTAPGSTPTAAESTTQPAVTDRGSYVQVWHREPDGKWLFARELWNSTTPLRGP